MGHLDCELPGHRSMYRRLRHHAKRRHRRALWGAAAESGPPTNSTGDRSESERSPVSEARRATPAPGGPTPRTPFNGDDRRIGHFVDGLPPSKSGADTCATAAWVLSGRCPGGDAGLRQRKRMPPSPSGNRYVHLLLPVSSPLAKGHQRERQQTPQGVLPEWVRHLGHRRGYAGRGSCTYTHRCLLCHFTSLLITRPTGHRARRASDAPLDAEEAEAEDHPPPSLFFLL